jgi:hypothetical protein
MIITPYASFSRPADTTSYAQGDLVANDVDQGDVIPLRFGVGKLGYGTGKVVGGRLHKDDETVTNADFILHLFTAEPDPSVGDNAQLNSTGTYAVASLESYIGSITFDMTTGAAATSGSLTESVALTAPLYFDLELETNAGRVLYGLLEADAAYAPASGEIFKIWLHIENEA